jgi:glutamate synthase domain-containing protein 1
MNMNAGLHARKMIASRKGLIPDERSLPLKREAAEGGCGVIGLASNVQVAAKHMLQSLIQMRNRGNGKGGGIAAVGLVAEEFGVTQEILENDYLLAVAYLDQSIQEELEDEYIYSVFDVDHVRVEEHIPDFTAIGLEVRPPEVVEYFVRVKPEFLEDFILEHEMGDVSQRKVEDEIVFQNSFKLNTKYYQSTGEKQAFVLSHGKNMLVLKMVAYGDDVIHYYQLEEMRANVWIGHHRYPTKGRVWHPGGAHPFIGLNEALVHNGDFANHASISLRWQYRSLTCSTAYTTTSWNM